MTTQAINFTWRPVKFYGAYTDECAPGDADAFGVYMLKGDGTQEHIIDFGSETLAKRFILKAQRTRETQVQETDARADNQDALENVAMLTAMIDWDLVKTEEFEGQIGVLQAVISSAEEFERHHAHQANGDPDYWDGVDWYLATEEWFNNELAWQLYGDEIDG